jgi:hypothetical protein
VHSARRDTSALVVLLSQRPIRRCVCGDFRDKPIGECFDRGGEGGVGCAARSVCPDCDAGRELLEKRERGASDIQ